MESLAGKAAAQGNICHKAYEQLALAKLAKQQGKTKFDAEELGVFSVSGLDSDKFVVDALIRAFEYYKSITPHVEFKNKDYEQCLDWMNKGLSYRNGLTDPRKHEIVCPEQKFDLTIDKPWAKYDYTVGGESFQGQLSIKGTIDLIFKRSDDIYEIIDLKTGQKRTHWGGPKDGQEKTHEDLEKDKQLLLYYYAAKKVFPNVKQIILSIYYVNAGNMFSFPFDNETMIAAEAMIQKTYNDIVKITKPRLTKTWKCNRLCTFGKTPHSSMTINPNTGDYYTICEFMEKEVKDKGMTSVFNEHKESDAWLKYGDGGGRKAK